jgi:DNA-directed RNA polymerase beta subunit
MLEVPKKYGFEVVEFEKKKSRYKGTNLINTVKDNIVLKLKKFDQVIDLSILVPRLINNQWFNINGKFKIPRFQLYDIPILTLYFKNEIRIQSNLGRISVYWDPKVKKKKKSFVHILVLNKKIPFSLVLYAFYGVEKTCEIFLSGIDEDKINSINPENAGILDLLRIDLLDAKSDMPKDFYIEAIGEYFSKKNMKEKGNDCIFTLENILNIDVIIKQFIPHDNVIDCLTEIILKSIEIDDVNYINKRLRCFEYIILQYFMDNIYKLCLNCRNSKKPKYNINKTKILGSCNVSDIIQYDFCINPIEQLTKLTQCALTGPNGFKKESIPVKLRDLNNSMYGKICPVDTPDRENCGVVQNINPTAKFDNTFKFIENNNSKIVPSIAVSMVPFLEHDDQTRLQMAASQMRQAVLLDEFQTPLICSGMEKQFSRYTDFIIYADYDGKVLFKDNRKMIIGYKNGTLKIIDMGVKKIVSDNMSYMFSNLKMNDTFEKDEIIAYSSFCKNGLIKFGRNFRVAFMSYYGYNNEDGIVISDKLVNENCLTSNHYIDLSFNISPNKVLERLVDSDKYIPLHPIGTKLNKGDAYARIRDMYLFGSFKDQVYEIFKDCTEKITPKNILITDIKIYANEWYNGINEYDAWIKYNIEKQIDYSNNLMNIVHNNTNKEEAKRLIMEHRLDELMYPTEYKRKDEKLKGVHVEITAVYERPIQVGDKLANRHGNKGIITSIMKHETMPELPNGEHVDICLNPMGVLSRMNVGQLFEIHLSEALMNFKNQLHKLIDNNTDQNEIKKLLIEFISMTDKTKSKWIISSFKEILPEIIDKKFIDDLYIIQPQFNSIKKEDIDKIMEYTNSDYEVKLFDPVSNNFVENDVAVGYMYLMKLTHIAENKLAYRSINTLSRKTMQPTAGKKMNGGQRCGEMESGCAVSNDMPINQTEFYTIKSDCIDAKNNFLKQELNTEFTMIKENPDLEPETIKLLRANLRVLGIDFDGNE